jgi:hypothetical protein
MAVKLMGTLALVADRTKAELRRTVEIERCYQRLLLKHHDDFVPVEEVAQIWQSPQRFLVGFPGC